MRCSRLSALAFVMAAAALVAVNLGADSPSKVATKRSGPDVALYTQSGSDPTFKKLLEEKKFPVGESSSEGQTGSAIRVNHNILDKLTTAKHEIPRQISIHTLCNSAIHRKDFAKWSRWYQEDGHTQVFRLFKDEMNVRNDRPLAARVEAFSSLHWTSGEWHEWEGTFTLVRPHGCMIFQVKNTDDDWAMSILTNDAGEVVLQDRRPKTRTKLAEDMIGKSFVLKVRDNGREYEVFFNTKKVGEGHFDRPKGTTAFRWGMYLGESEVKHDAMIFVTGAKFK